MDVSVIIVNYHSAPLVIDCVRSVKEKTRCTYEIIVVDNASGDGSVETLREAFGDTVTVIASDENLGFGKANNLGVKHATGDYVFLLNPDTVLVNDAIDILLDYIKTHEDVGVAGGNLVFPDMRPAPSFCREFSTPKTEKQQSTWRYLLKTRFSRGKQPKQTTEYNYTDAPEKVAYVFGADMMLKKTLYEEIGGFDPDFFMYGEETELMWRITQKGYRVVCVPQSRIIHLEGATTKTSEEFSARQFAMRMNGTMTYYHKCFGEKGLRDFYRYRYRRYDRQIKMASLKSRLPEKHPVCQQRRILKDVFEEYIQKRGERHG